MIFITLSLSSQELKIGLKGGVNNYSIGELFHLGPNGGNGVTPSEDTYYTADKGMNIQYGLFFMANFDKFFIRPEIIITSIENTYPLALQDSKWTASKIDVPILFGYYVYYPVAIYLGPELSTISDMELEGLETHLTPLIYNQTSLNMNIGIMVDFKNFGLDLRYTRGLSKFEEQRIDMVRSSYGTNVGYLQEYTPSQLSISLHVNLFDFSTLKKSRGPGSDWRNHKNL